MKIVVFKRQNMITPNVFFLVSYATFCSANIFIIAALLNLRYVAYTLLGYTWTEYEFDDPAFEILLAIGVASWLLTCVFMSADFYIRVCVRKETQWEADGVHHRPVEMVRLNADV